MNPLLRAIPSLLALSGFTAALASPALAVPLTLLDGGAVLEVDPESREGIGPWTVDGITHLRQQGFWIRAGADTAERSFADLDWVGAVVSDGDLDGDDDTVVIDWSDPAGRFAVSVQITLFGLLGSAQAGSTSDIALDFNLENRSGGDLDVALFQYSDVDLFGSFVDDEAIFSTGLAITDSSGLGSYAASFAGMPSAVEASLFDALLASLEDDGVTTLSGALQAAGDVTTAVAFQQTLAAGGVLDFQQEQSIRVDPLSVAEPAGLAALGLLLAVRRRSR